MPHVPPVSWSQEGVAGRCWHRFKFPSQSGPPVSWSIVVVGSSAICNNKYQCKLVTKSRVEITLAIARRFVAGSTPRCSSSATCRQSNQGLGITGRPSYQAVRGKLGEVLVRGLGGLWYDRPFRYRTVLELCGLHGRKSVISSGLELANLPKPGRPERRAPQGL